MYTIFVFSFVSSCRANSAFNSDERGDSNSAGIKGRRIDKQEAVFARDN
jgi:hypothetical protein